MDTLIKSTQEKWLEAKKKASTRIRKTKPELADKIDRCDMFTGEESIEELARLMFTPQGREFMLANSFPTLTQFRKFKKYNPEHFNVYIDSGNITLNEPGDIYLIGNTTAEVYCRKTASHHIILMHGASATIYAGGYSVINPETDNKSEIIIKAAPTAKVL